MIIVVSSAQLHSILSLGSISDCHVFVCGFIAVFILCFSQSIFIGSVIPQIYGKGTMSLFSALVLCVHFVSFLSPSF